MKTTEFAGRKERVCIGFSKKMREFAVKPAGVFFSFLKMIAVVGAFPTEIKT